MNITIDHSAEQRARSHNAGGCHAGIFVDLQPGDLKQRQSTAEQGSPLWHGHTCGSKCMRSVGVYVSLRCARPERKQVDNMRDNTRRLAANLLHQGAANTKVSFAPAWHWRMLAKRGRCNPTFEVSISAHL
jgi:hypothetical protein